MGRAIPDEIIHEILSPALSVPDDTFSADIPVWKSRACRGRRVESSSAILLVCKAWLRVATPLLYHTVNLRSKSQAQALSVALRSNPDLGRLVKKLRLRSGYGISMHKILQRTQNLTDIFIPLEFDLGDNARGLCRGFPLIDPVRVTISYLFDMTSPVRTLVDVLVECIPKWKKLAIFEMSYDSVEGAHDMFSSPLRVAPDLQTLVLSCNEKYLFKNGAIPQFISTIIRNASLQEIRPKTRSRNVLDPEFLQAVQGGVRLQELVDPNLFDPTKAFVYPPQLAANPTAADDIWDRILYFVFCEPEDDDDFDYELEYSEEAGSDDDEWEYGHQIRTGKRWEFLRVCKQFLRLGTPHLYNTMCIQTCKAMRLFTEHLLQQPSLGAHVRRLILSTHDERTIHDLQTVFSQVSRLAVLSSTKTLILPWHLFDELSLRYGSHLKLFLGVTVTRCPHRVDPMIFRRLSKMRIFTWNSDTEFHTTVTFAASNALDGLKKLTVRQAHPSFFIILSQMQLPSLNTVALFTGSVDTRVFFQRHGEKISDLFVGASAFNLEMFNSCPNVKHLHVSIASKHEQSFLEGVLSQCDTHCFLERIVIDPEGFDGEHSELFELFQVFLAKFDRTPFPALQEIRHLGFEWHPPASIPRDLPVELAEKFRAQNTHLSDADGHWCRPVFAPERRQQLELSAS
ncbi:hypothetical protein FB45DRAFT_848494 [Roridomyces roridus]|uniref:F-box domain-containing protein n=1 Tax=Roridomyces roridus TaxID=1738132 RepID=A0AAD7B068_9AGAR|nr:hypothetical protein FB45DRAFT_848494 [Roridomyces roridus]